MLSQCRGPGRRRAPAKLAARYSHHPSRTKTVDIPGSFDRAPLASTRATCSLTSSCTSRSSVYSPAAREIKSIILAPCTSAVIDPTPA
eukprot:1857578-Rhodomonas_salina.3